MTVVFDGAVPPENTQISNVTINVEEGMQPPRVTCASRANPEATYEWTRKEIVIGKQSVLIVTRNVTREDDGSYFCVASNKHGAHQTSTHMNVQCECLKMVGIFCFALSITQHDIQY